MSEQPKLKLCPFCGKEATANRYNNCGCPDARCPGGGMFHEPENWNRRALDLEPVKRVRDEMRARLCASCGGTGWILVPAERKKYECGDCVSGMNISADDFKEWAYALSKWIEAQDA